MSMLDESTMTVGSEQVSQESQIERLAQDLDHLRTCFEQLIEVIDNQQDLSEDVSLLTERMSFFERRMQRAEDGVSDVSWALKRRASDR